MNPTLMALLALCLCLPKASEVGRMTLVRRIAEHRSHEDRRAARPAIATRAYHINWSAPLGDAPHLSARLPTGPAVGATRPWRIINVPRAPWRLQNDAPRPPKGGPDASKRPPRAVDDGSWRPEAVDDSFSTNFASILEPLAPQKPSNPRGLAPSPADLWV